MFTRLPVAFFVQFSAASVNDEPLGAQCKALCTIVNKVTPGAGPYKVKILSRLSLSPLSFVCALDAGRGRMTRW